MFKADHVISPGSQQSLINIMMELKKCCNHCELTCPLEMGHEDKHRLQSIVKGRLPLHLLLSEQAW